MTYQCEHQSFAEKAIIVALPESQARPARHKCAACAFKQGKDSWDHHLELSATDIDKCKHGSWSPKNAMSGLPFSQKGGHRHKCCVCAFSAGFEAGASQRNHSDIWSSEEKKKIQLVSDLKHLTLVNSEPSRKGARKANSAAGIVARAFYPDAELGLLGEVLVLAYEKARLSKAGKADLAERVRHVSQEVGGESKGYDILSSNDDGSERFIEVKTTSGALENPFFITKNELRFAKENARSYFLYRVHNVRIRMLTERKLQIFPGDPEGYTNLSPISYRADFKHR